MQAQKLYKSNKNQPSATTSNENKMVHVETTYSFSNTFQHNIFRKMLHSFFFLNCRNRDGNHFRATSILSCFFLCFFTAINPMLLKLCFKALICKRTRTNTKIVSCKPLYCKLTKYRGEQEKTINDFVACTWKYPISGGVLIKDGSFLS